MVVCVSTDTVLRVRQARGHVTPGPRSGVVCPGKSSTIWGKISTTSPEQFASLRFVGQITRGQGPFSTDSQTVFPVGPDTRGLFSSRVQRCGLWARDRLCMMSGHFCSLLLFPFMLMHFSVDHKWCFVFFSMLPSSVHDLCH